MKKPKSTLVLVNLLMSLSICAQYSIEWTGDKDNQWTEPSNWSKNRVPEENDVVLINTMFSKIPNFRTELLQQFKCIHYRSLPSQ